ncbi:hypothetical protein RhiJN_05804 [Ceratobasidium sp. AG-Ba]|nr:hypothetical protein RhiJN_05804 [Ceratobasidium sp. AG-Ba]QRW06734.1 hypothetical protein RhiLY_05733 [Ceratobasidium sp. AG-Ba]
MSSKSRASERKVSFLRLSGSSLRNGASQAWHMARPPIPGVTEITEAAERWVKGIGAEKSDNEQLDSLRKRIDTLLNMAQTSNCSQPPENSDIVKNLLNIKEKLNERSQHWRSGRILGAEQGQRTISDIEIGLDRAIEAYLVEIQERQIAAKGINNVPNSLCRMIEPP